MDDFLYELFFWLIAAIVITLFIINWIGGKYGA